MNAVAIDTTPAVTPRRSYTFVLKLVTTAPLTHGAGNHGNIQSLRTEEVLVPIKERRRDDDPLEPGIEKIIGYRNERVPIVSGAAVKATLREWAARDYLERAGLREGDVSKDHLRLLWKGGKVTSGGQTVSLDDMRRYMDLCPLLAVFGAMDGGFPLPASIRVSSARPFVDTYVKAGIAPERIRPMEVTLDGESMFDLEGGDLVFDQPPVPRALTTTEVTYYKHDMAQGGLSRMLPDTERKALMDARQQRSLIEKPDKETRREANESMPHTAQAIKTGVPMWVEIRLENATDVEAATLGYAMARWIGSGAHLGGGKTKGHGTCAVEVRGALSYTPPGADVVGFGNEIAIADETGEGGRLTRALNAHIEARRDAIRSWLGEQG